MNKRVEEPYQGERVFLEKSLIFLKIHVRPKKSFRGRFSSEARKSQ
jgi:hypothetical protein